MISFRCLLLDLHMKRVLNYRKLCCNEGVGLHIAAPGAALHIHVDLFARPYWEGNAGVRAAAPTLLRDIYILE